MSKKETSPDGVPNLRDQILGQEDVFRQLDQARAAGRLSHAFLFTGRSGSGKTRTAIALAQGLLCSPEDIPGRKKVARLVHSDLHFVFPQIKDETKDPSRVQALLQAYAKDLYSTLGSSDTATIGIDQVRSLKERVAMAPVEGERRVVIWSQAHRMTEPAAQSCLKLIEEPPENTTLILCADDTAQVLPTLVSRCQQVRIRPLSLQTLREHAEAEGSRGAEARLVSALARGSLHRLMTLLDAGVTEARDQALQLFTVAKPSAIAQRVESVSRRWDASAAHLTVELLLMWYHDVLWLQAGLPRDGLVHSDRVPQLTQQAGELDPLEIRRRLAILEQLVVAVDQYVNPSLALQAALSQLAGREDLVDLAFLSV